PLGIGITATNSQGPASAWTLEALNNIIVDGQTGISVDGASLLDPTISHNDVHGNSAGDYVGELSDQTGTSGNISVDPRFTHATTGDYSLQPASPCIDAAVSAPGVPVTDINGAPRPQDGNGDGVSVPDMGAYEYSLPDLDHDGYPAGVDCND